MIPFHNIKLQHRALREEFMHAIGSVIDSGEFSGGPFVARFEQEFAAYCGVNSAVGVGSGTEALWLTLLAMRIGAGDEVITVPMSFAATVEAICFAGATPVFVDIDEQSYTMDPSSIEQAITPRTKAIIPVHLFGQVADMDPIINIARRHGLRVIEDTAQAHGAQYKGRKAGALSDAGCFSFYPGKNLGAFGEGGAIVTDDEELMHDLRMLRDHGQSSKNRHSMVGWNSRLDGIQSAILTVKLKYLDAENQRRRDHALRYSQGLQISHNVITPHMKELGKHVFHIYAIRVPNRSHILHVLDEQSICYGVHYPVPIHLQSAYQSMGYRRGAFPVAERCADEFVSLPLFPEMTSTQTALIIDVVCSAARA